MKKITIIIPVYNEEDVIPELTKRLTAFIDTYRLYLFEIIFVENGSYDKSYPYLLKKAIADKRFKILQLSKNFLVDNAISAGMKYATGDACVILMADLQEPFSVVDKFIKKWEDGYEVVYGIVKKRTGSPIRIFFSSLFYSCLNLLTGNLFPKNVSDFRLIDKKVYQVVNQMDEQNKYLRGIITWTGFKQTGIPFTRNARFAGKSKAGFKTLLKVARNGIFSFSYVPLYFISYLGFFVTAVSFILIIFYLSLYFIYGRETPGVITIILINLFLFGILFFSLGIISQYLARIYDEVKKRPSVIINKKINLNI